MAEETIKVGDVVQLKSGGPEMTIESGDQEDGFRCVWFDGSTQKFDYYKPAALKKPDPPYKGGSVGGGRKTS